MDETVKKLKEYMDASHNTVAITGSGISYMYGMRRLKQQTGRMNAMRKLNPDYVKKHPEDVYALLKDSFLDATFEKGPSPVHYQLAELEKQGKLQGIVTQNLDGLHTLAGSKNVVAFMGSFAESICIDCGTQVDDINVWNEGEMPHCPHCDGYLLPAFFARGMAAGGNGANEKMQQAQDMIAQAELLLIIGTTGFRSEEYMARVSPSAKLVQINPSSTMFDSMVHLHVRMDAEKVFQQLLAEEE